VQRPGLHDGQTAEVLVDDEVVGIIGRIHPKAARQLDVPADTFLAELVLADVLAGQVPSYRDISKFPETRRDIAVVVNSEQSADAIMSDVRAVAGVCLVDLRLFDVYQGKGVESDQKSLALGLTFRDNSRTLDDTEVTRLMTQVVDSLKKNFGAALRT
jgi:phenylalanyl-tRNA synthetase beta chain